MIHFCADTHFRHSNILKYCSRPFNTIEEHDKTIKKNWNNAVNPGDTVYFLGDWCFGSRLDALNYIRELNGYIKFIWGNHDKALKDLKRFAHHFSPELDRVEFLGDYAEITYQHQFIVLSHYAFRVFNKSHYGSWNLFGHSHATLPDDPHSLSIDIGVDAHAYTPISFEKVKEIMSKKFWRPIDHHDAKREDGGGVGLGREEYAKAQRRTQYLQLKEEFES
jgi:calcineurin-like phosphoesterase family protein